MTRSKLLLTFYFLALLGLAAQPQSSSTVQARAELEQATIIIGDQVWLKIMISAPPGTSIEALDSESVLSETGIEVVKGNPVMTIAETPELLLEQRTLITSFDTGYVFIPTMRYPYKMADGSTDTAQTEPLLLTIRGVPISEDDELMPIKPIIKEPLNWLDFWPAYLGIAVILIAYLSYLLISRRGQTSRKAPPPPPKTAYDLALERLDGLAAKKLWQQGELKPYYSELSYILRTYLEGQFKIPALESTTRQIDRALHERKQLSDGQRSELAELLQLSDLVKFAKAQPAEDLHQQGLDRVREFVEATGHQDLLVPTAIQQPTISELANEEE